MAPQATGGIAKLPASGAETLLTSNEVRQLIAFSEEIEKRFQQHDERGQPAAADVEFAFVNGRLWLLQIRPFNESRQAQASAYMAKIDEAKACSILGLADGHPIKISLREHPELPVNTLSFMFADTWGDLAYCKSIDDDPKATVCGVPNRWFWALFYSGVSVLVELPLNKGGLLVWDYRWWNRGLVEVLPIFLFGYLWFYLAAKFAIERKTLRAKVRVPLTLFVVAVLLNFVGLGLLAWTY